MQYQEDTFSKFDHFMPKKKDLKLTEGVSGLRVVSTSATEKVLISSWDTNAGLAGDSAAPGGGRLGCRLHRLTLHHLNTGQHKTKSQWRFLVVLLQNSHYVCPECVCRVLCGHYLYSVLWRTNDGEGRSGCRLLVPLLILALRRWEGNKSLRWDAWYDGLLPWCLHLQYVFLPHVFRSVFKLNIVCV